MEYIKRLDSKHEKLLAIRKQLEQAGNKQERKKIDLYPPSIPPEALLDLCGPKRPKSHYASMVEKTGYQLLGLSYQQHIQDAYQESVSIQATEKADKKWEKHNQERPQLKEKYLKIMREKGFTSMSRASEYIFANENPENKKYQWIYERLREAVKGNFD